jgi:hypothetical protein
MQNGKKEASRQFAIGSCSRLVYSGLLTSLRLPENKLCQLPIDFC